MALQYPTPVQTSSPNGIKKFRYSVSEQPDAIFDFATESGLPEEIWTKKDGLVGRWAADSRVFQANSLWVFELACWKKAWNWDGGGIGFMTALAEGSSEPGEGGVGYLRTLYGPDHGLVGDGVADDTAALQTLVNAAGYNNGKIVLAPGMYRITDSIYIDGGHGRPNNAVQICGELYSGGTVYESATRIIWDGPTNKPAFWFRGFDHSVLGLGFEAAPTKHLLCGVALTGYAFPGVDEDGDGLDDETGRPVTGTVFSSQLLVKGCVFTNYGQANSTRSIKYGVAIGGTSELGWFGSNLENCEISYSSFSGCVEGGVLFHGGQAINSVIRKCNFTGWNGVLNGALAASNGGAGVINDSPSTILQVYDTDFQSIGQWFRVLYPFQLTMTGGESEHSHSMLWNPNYSWDSYMYGYTFRDLRVVTDMLGVPSADGVMGAGTLEFVRNYMGSNLSFENSNFYVDQNSYMTAREDGGRDFYIGSLAGATVTAKNCVFPNSNPFSCFALGWEAFCKGGVWLEGCKWGLDAGGAHPPGLGPMADRKGSWNPPGFVTISGTDTEAPVSFLFNQLDTRYQIKLTLSSMSNDAAFGTAVAHPKTPTGFTLKLSVAPGASKSVTYRWEIEKDITG